MTKLIILDRDGVINKDYPNHVRSPEMWSAIPGSLEAIAKLKNKGYKIAIATNQSGVARCYVTLATLETIHKKMLSQIQKAGGNIDAIFFCPHHPDDNCDCRKPKPGLLLQALNRFSVDPEEAIMIGDATRDLLAAKNCGVKSIFVKTGYKEKDLLAAQKSGVPIYKDLAEAVEHLI